MALVDSINTKTTISFPEGKPDVQAPEFTAGVAQVTVENLLTFVKPAILSADSTINLVAGSQLRDGARVILITESGSTAYNVTVGAGANTSVIAEAIPGAVNTTNTLQLIYLQGVFYMVGNPIV